MRSHKIRSARVSVVMNTLALKQRIAPEAVERISTLVLVHFDACKLGAGTTFSANLLTMHLTTMMFLGSRLRSQALYDLGNNAYAKLLTACDRCTDERAGRFDPINLTTREYTSLRAAISVYLRDVLPRLDWKQYLSCEATAYARLKIEPEMQAALQGSTLKLTNTLTAANTDVHALAA